MQTSEITVVGTRQVQVTCPACSHTYEYTLRREGSGADELTARNKLAEALNTDCEIVPCPQCGAISEDMEQQRAAGQNAGVVLSVVGLVICLATLIIWSSTGYLFFTVGGVGLAFFFIGLGTVFRMDETPPRQPDDQPR